MNNIDDNEYMSISPSKIDFQQYLGSIKEAILQITKEQLVGNISLSINEFKDKSVENNKDSLQLLQAMKPFMDDRASESIDKLAEVFSDIQALKMFIDSFFDPSRSSDEYTIEDAEEKKVVDKQGDLIIEENTVYEIDEQCEPEVCAQNFGKSDNKSIFAVLLYMLGSK